MRSRDILPSLSPGIDRDGHPSFQPVRNSSYSGVFLARTGSSTRKSSGTLRFYQLLFASCSDYLPATSGLRPQLIAIHCETLKIMIPQPAERSLHLSARIGSCASQQAACRLTARSSTSWATQSRITRTPMAGRITPRFWTLPAGRAIVALGSRSGTGSSRHRFIWLLPVRTITAC